MRALLMASALSALLFAPVGAYAAGAGQQSTGAQSDLRQNVKAKHSTYKRHQIIRSELNKNKPDVRR
ncbi:MAG TPA: hypothetical protein VFU97_07785 [Xanthobacteraceae bacterium]|nr:hypothetical protein [Xanthobacteraceae bacterium]